MDVLKFANLGLRFLLELCALAALAYWGFTLDKGLLLKIVAGIGAPLFAAIVWGTFVAPKAPYLVDEPLRILVELAVFGSATWALFATGHSNLVWVFAITVVVNRVLIIVWGQ